MSRLSLELVPRSAWYNNVRKHTTKGEWEKCKAYARERTGGKCIICGATGFDQGRRYAVDAHEVWHYDDEARVQTLIDIIPLCPMCHACKHLGHTRENSTLGQWEKVIEHFGRVNEWSPEKVEKYVLLAFDIWELRSQTHWDLDLTFLSLIGVKTKP